MWKNLVAAARAVAEKYPHQANILWTTCVATMLHAGNAPNALPQNATANVNCRIFPGTSVADVQKTIAQAIGNDKLTVSLVGEGVASAEDIDKTIRDGLGLQRAVGRLRGLDGGLRGGRRPLSGALGDGRVGL